MDESSNTTHDEPALTTDPAMINISEGMKRNHHIALARIQLEAEEVIAYYQALKTKLGHHLSAELTHDWHAARHGYTCGCSAHRDS